MATGITAKDIMTIDPTKRVIPSARVQKLQKEIDRLNYQMTQTDSDMFEYYALLDIERIEKLIAQYTKVDT